MTLEDLMVEAQKTLDCGKIEFLKQANRFRLHIFDEDSAICYHPKLVIIELQEDTDDYVIDLAVEGRAH